MTDEEAEAIFAKVYREASERLERNIAQEIAYIIETAPDRQIIGPGEVAALTGLSRKTVRKLTLSGIIPIAYEMDSGQFRYRSGAVRDWFNSTTLLVEPSVRQ